MPETPWRCATWACRVSEWVVWLQGSDHWDFASFTLFTLKPCSPQAAHANDWMVNGTNDENSRTRPFSFTPEPSAGLTAARLVLLYSLRLALLNPPPFSLSSSRGHTDVSWSGGSPCLFLPSLPLSSPSVFPINLLIPSWLLLPLRTELTYHPVRSIFARAGSKWLSCHMDPVIEVASSMWICFENRRSCRDIGYSYYYSQDGPLKVEWQAIKSNSLEGVAFS